MEKKIIFILEILLIIGASIYYIIAEVLPEYREKFGSSDTFLKTDDYKNMIEFKIDKTVNFSLLLNNQKKIFHIMFFDKNSICLYNKDIENKDVDIALEEVIKILIENDYLKSSSIVSITRYDDYLYDYFKNILIVTLEKYHLNTNILEDKSSLMEKATELELKPIKDQKKILSNMDYYSKEFPRSLNTVSNNNDDIILSENTSKRVTNSVYKKIEEFVLKNDIKYLDQNNTDLVISLIPADSTGKYYPSSNSWYYVKDGKVYAYIEIIDNNKSYSYCYRGSIDLVTEGEC